MQPPAIRSTRSRTIAAALACSLMFSPPLLITPAQADPDTTHTSTNPQTAVGLDWGLRASFVSYVGGATVVDSGATKLFSSDDADEHTTENAYRFTLADAGYDSATHTTTAAFSGRVEFFQYCNGQTPARGNCDLELTFVNPKIVITDDDAYLTMDVRSKQYPAGDVFEKTGARVADLDLSAATVATTDGVTTWTNIVPMLAADGVKAFSGFYDAGEALAPLSFSYVGEGAPSTGREAGWKLTAQQRTSVTADGARLFAADDAVIVAGKDTIEVLDGKTLAQRHTVAVAEGRKNVLAGLTGDGGVVFVDGREVKVLSIADGSTAVLATLPESAPYSGQGPVALTVTAVTDGWQAAIVINRGNATAELQVVSGRGNAVRETAVYPIVDPRTTIDELAHVPDEQKASWIVTLVGEDYSFSSMRDLVSADDGSYLLLSQSSVYVSDEESHRVPPLRITVDEDAKTASVTYLAGSDAIPAMRPSSMQMTGNTVVFATDSWRDGQVASYTYADGSLQSVHGPDTITVDDSTLGEIAGVHIVDDSTALISAVSDSSIHWVNLDDHSVESAVAIPNAKDTDGPYRSLVQADAGTIYVLGIVMDNSTWEEYLQVNKLTKVEPTQPPAEDESSLEGKLPPITTPDDPDTPETADTSTGSKPDTPEESPEEPVVETPADGDAAQDNGGVGNDDGPQEGDSESTDTAGQDDEAQPEEADDPAPQPTQPDEAEGNTDASDSADTANQPADGTTVGQPEQPTEEPETPALPEQPSGEPEQPGSDENSATDDVADQPADVTPDEDKPAVNTPTESSPAADGDKKPAEQRPTGQASGSSIPSIFGAVGGAFAAGLLAVASLVALIFTVLLPRG
ncbi:HtaA domain-containing protein [Corynebacterium choanae]|uniref:Htaa n=1 Tax=Corynebacterium choanae TaxID=1862358 RepID=A0A3G6J6N0_9CORY|nr:HtaA domain-containing protein [Corynebacterium choanae]AZA12578.1 Htaa [Corynebacterium choanae]